MDHGLLEPLRDEVEARIGGLQGGSDANGCEEEELARHVPRRSPHRLEASLTNFDRGLARLVRGAAAGAHLWADAVAGLAVAAIAREVGGARRGRR